MTRYLPLVAFYIFWLSGISAGQPSEAARDLAFSRIQQTQRELDNIELTKHNELAQLRTIELERMQLETELDQITTSLKLSASAFSGLNTVNDQLRTKLEDQVSLLEKLTMVAYGLHKSSGLKILFHIKDTDQWYRHFAYYRFITAYQLSLSARANANLKIQETLLEELIKTREQISKNKGFLEQRLTQLSAIEKQRQQIIANIDSDIKDSEVQLERLNKNLRRVDELAIDLGNLQLDEIALAETNFRTLRGNLPLPAQGDVNITFRQNNDAPNQRSGLHYKGLIIETKYGSPVKAIARGNVVFSDWLRGFGLVIILDHGNNFLSLYAHNRRFVKQLGDWVDAGAVISMVGETGGRNKPELYFELRHKSVALNPELWLDLS